MTRAMILTGFTCEHQGKEAHHVVRRQAGDDDANQPEDDMTLSQNRPRISSLLKNPAKRRRPGDGEDTRQEGPVDERLLAGEPTHLTNILFAVEIMGTIPAPERGGP